MRPLEFFNLSAVHGPVYEWPDDYFDDEGEAYPALTEAESDALLALPSLPQLRGDVRRLVQYALVSPGPPREVSALLAEFEPWEVQQVLDERIAVYPYRLGQCLEIAAEALGPRAYHWVKHRLAHYPQADIGVFAPALARCFPVAEGEAIMLGSLSQLSEKSLMQRIHCLSPFSGNGPLDWLENQRSRIHTVSDGYGMTVALVGISWERVQRWLRLGRPLSLIALDAVVNCSTACLNPDQYRRFRLNPPRLLAPAPVAEMNRVLAQYLERDSVPRTRKAVRFIQQNWDNILKSES
ncbi:hypothetical protein DLM85_09850 [Hymenobacter edaphi]|uniref:HEAT repeat domain-containing protein n=1 Tax=Hymenobacter edaphi TaxID=2211146 RepID=A0A328BLR7_9BACT|nr:hypothetical protein DLM85_09850 [Hymenobacter edaphi]